MTKLILAIGMLLLAGCNTLYAQNYAIRFYITTNPIESNCSNCYALVGGSGCVPIDNNIYNWEEEIYAIQRTDSYIKISDEIDSELHIPQIIEIEKPITFGEMCSKDNVKCEIVKGDCQ